MKSILIILMSLSTTIYGCSSSNDEVVQEELSKPWGFSLSDTEKQDLLFLREEEKLARDVYLYAYNLYHHQVFYNISQSEQTHMDQILALLNNYRIKDPALNEPGSFSNHTLQMLYDELTNQVDISLLEALKVGATIEDLDINDIASFESNTLKVDILNVYSILKCGSRNHLRSFIYQLDMYDYDYIPQYISEEDFNEIINSYNERCGRNW